MKIVKVDELKIGDEIIIPCQSFFKYLRVLKNPEKNSKTGWYKSVKCSGRRDSLTTSFTNYKGEVIYYDVKTWKFTGDDHNIKQYVQLDGREILLIKSEDYG